MSWKAESQAKVLQVFRVRVRQALISYPRQVLLKHWGDWAKR